MDLMLRSIQFQSVPQGSLSTIPIRPGPDDPVPTLPEWQAGGGAAAVAWRLDQTRDKQLQVRVSFVSGVSQSLEIMATDPTGANLSGSIPIFTIQTVANVPTSATVRLEAPLLTEAGQQKIASHLDAWQWSARVTGTGAWTPIAVTMHRAYAVLTAPNLPWSGGDPNLFVWTKVLDVACVWAAGATDATGVSNKIAKAFFTLGSLAANARLTYGGGSSFCQILTNSYNCIDLIEFLQTGGSPRTSTVDCHDAACTVSTFANALGAALIQGELECNGKDISTNQVVLIGGQDTSTSFGVHVLAWGGNGTSMDPVWDGCLMVDGDAAPADPPHDFTVAAAMPFTAAHGIGYRERLAIPGDAQHIITSAHKKLTDNRPLARRNPPPAHRPTGGDNHAPVDMVAFLNTVNLAPWHIFEWFTQTAAADVTAYLSIVTLSTDGTGSHENVDWYRCLSIRRAREVLTQLKRLLSGATVPVADLGQGAFGLANGNAVLFQYKNLAIRVTKSSMDRDAFQGLPQQVNRALAAAFADRLLI